MKNAVKTVKNTVKTVNKNSEIGNNFLPYSQGPSRATSWSPSSSVSRRKRSSLFAVMQSQATIKENYDTERATTINEHDAPRMGRASSASNVACVVESVTSVPEPASQASGSSGGDVGGPETRGAQRSDPAPEAYYTGCPPPF